MPARLVVRAGRVRERQVCYRHWCLMEAPGRQGAQIPTTRRRRGDWETTRHDTTHTTLTRGSRSSQTWLRDARCPRLNPYDTGRVATATRSASTMLSSPGITGWETEFIGAQRIYAHGWPGFALFYFLGRP